MLRSLFSAFLMYSRIPMPRTEWKEENRRYALGFFPLVGTVICILFMIWIQLCVIMNIGSLLFSAGAVLIPILVTGGIHLDGFCDVEDAMASFGDAEKRLEIMKDPHIGSFAVIRLGMLLIIQTGLFSQVTDKKTAVTVGLGYILSRSLSGLSAVTLKSARSDGTLQSFVKPSHRNIIIGMTASFMLLSVAGMVCFGSVCGICSAAAALLTMMYFKRYAYRHFRGITGDLCGWFLQLCEVWILAAAVFSERIMEVIR